MLANDVCNKDELSALVISELKELGVKYRKEKKSKTGQDKCNRKRIFRVHLHVLELTDVVLANGGIVQIPQFVSVACQRILEQVETEGLFRKAGSTLRQKEIRASLENGLPLGRTHHIIDVANVLKLFFRELPEPLLPPGLQEALLRSLLIADGKVQAILMTCLLLPPLTVNTLAFFMQFLNTVSLSSHQNRMSIENLAIIFMPGLMPLADIQGFRFNNHVKVIQLLIENAELIGVLPKKISDKLNITINSTELITKKKKKRRSGMFNGFKKIVGALGSSENLENTPDHSMNPTTPCLTKSKKRKMAEAAPGFSAKKKKELLGLLPEGGILPNTPLCTKETKKTRLSLGVRRHLKNSTSGCAGPATVERRWSVVGSGWSRKKSNLDKKGSLIPLSPVISLPCITDIDLPKIDFEDFTSSIFTKKQFHSGSNDSTDESCKSFDPDYVRIPKSEYEAIKERVSTIEKRISQEFGNVRSSLNRSKSHSPEPSKLSEMDLFTGPEKVMDKFERTCEETVNMVTSPSTDQLAKRLSRELKIRRNSEQRVMRSPSARKIGTIRRRSREAIRLSRNATWHNIPSTKGVAQTSVATETGTNPGISFYPKSNLKRGRPNTVQTGLHNRPPSNCSEKEQSVDNQNTENSENLIESEQWTAGEEFFEKNLQIKDNSSNDSLIFVTPKTKMLRKKSTTPNSINDNTKTPMLPPKSIPRRNNNQSKTPLSVAPARLSGKTTNCFSNRLLMSPLDELHNGRASIARLRAINAGMVLAKAKHFDGLGNESDRYATTSSIQTEVTETNPIDNRRRSSRFIVNKFDHGTNPVNPYVLSPINATTTKQSSSPRKKIPTKSPSSIQKRQRFVTTKYPERNSCADEISMKRSTGKSFTNVDKNIMNTPKVEFCTPRIKKSLKINSPRRLIRTPRHDEHQQQTRTPIKATPNAVRHSPRFFVKQFAL